jgi:hypothetical protein
MTCGVVLGSLACFFFFIADLSKKERDCQLEKDNWLVNDVTMARAVSRASHLYGRTVQVDQNKAWKQYSSVLCN